MTMDALIILGAFALSIGLAVCVGFYAIGTVFKLHREQKRRRANPALHVGLWTALLAYGGWAALLVRSVAIHLLDYGPEGVVARLQVVARALLRGQPDLAGAITTLGVSVAGSVMGFLLIRGSRAVIFPEEPGDVPGTGKMRKLRVSSAVLLIVVICLAASASRAMGW